MGIVSGSVVIADPTAPSTRVTATSQGSTTFTSPGAMGPPGAGVNLAGAVETYPELPELEPEDAGTAYMVNSDGLLYVWTGSSWPAEGMGGAFRGPTGLTGPAGATGPTGANGDKGNKGDTGEQGPQGVQGPQGLKGDKGDTGAMGPEGPKGDTGEQGEGVHIDGAVADYASLPSSGVEPGEGWITNDDGMMYIYGSPGFPAYGNGFQLRGPQGPAGATGATGSQGPPGNTGAPGAAGAQGPQGDEGPPGEVSEAELNAAISAALDQVIDGSPGALDTLNELAAALGDDPNFAATVTAQIATKADKLRQIIAGAGLTGGGTLEADRTLAVDFGTGTNQAVRGDDARMTNARTPTSHQHNASDINAGTLNIARIADGAVTLAKLATAVQTSLGKADSAVQPGASGSVVVGTLPGTGVSGVLYVVP